MEDIKIKEVKTILTAPAGINLVVVKVITDKKDLYGLGCATFTQRYLTVAAAVEDYLNPLLKGKSVHNIEDIWHSTINSSYWRNGPVLNNALSGVDMALWDIKGKIAGMPVYQLLGGKAREGVPVYRHAGGNTLEEVEKNVYKFMEQGVRYIRCQMGGYGGSSSGIVKPENAPTGAYFHPERYMEKTIEMFDYIREKIGYQVELLHDVHERISPVQAIGLAKELEPYRLFFLEDVLAPEDKDWFARIRQQSSIPLAMGELFNNPSEWHSLIKDNLIDFIRVHISQIGGLTPALKLAHQCAASGIKTAWHGPGDVSPVGHVVNVHLDLVLNNFGIQEFCGFNKELKEVFPGCPQLKDGYLYANDKPGLGIDIDEKKAALYPCKKKLPTWTNTRLPDGTAVRP